MISFLDSTSTHKLSVTVVGMHKLILCIMFFGGGEPTKHLWSLLGNPLGIQHINQPMSTFSMFGGE